MPSKEPTSVRLSEELLQEVDDVLLEAKNRGMLPPTAKRSDMIRVSILNLVDEAKEDFDGLEDKLRAYYTARSNGN